MKTKILSLFINRRFDWWIFFAALFLTFFSLLALYSLTFLGVMDKLSFFKQLGFVVTGVVVLFFFSNLNYNAWRVYNRYLYVLGIVLLLAVLLFGTVINGTKGWFFIAGFGIQPVEFVKLALIVSLSAYLSRRINLIPYWRLFLESAVLTGIFVILVMFQPDLGSSMILVAVWLGMLILTGLPWRYVLGILLAVVSVALLAWFFFLADYQKNRLMVLWDPSLDPLGAGYNINQSMIAIGSGSWLGQGLGLGSQSQLKFIPERMTDFILAVIGEEFGFVGFALLLILWAIIFWRLIILARRAPNNFAYLLLCGIAIVFFVHVVINVGMNLGVMPVIGVSLPFLSQGGSFLLMCFMFLGITENIYMKI
jgi:rod shape determining protein RodA